MNGKKVTIVATVALVVGLLAGYLFWQARLRSLAGQRTELQSRVAEARQAAERQQELSTKLRDLEARLAQLTDQLAAERAKREELEDRMAAGRK
jgi:septal ring factor EnvC (AmiA/AmiB activator)